MTENHCFSAFKDVLFSRKTLQKQITVRIAYTLTPQAVFSIAVSQEQHSIKVVLMVEVYHFSLSFINVSIEAASFGFKYAVSIMILSPATAVKIQMLS